MKALTRDLFTIQTPRTLAAAVVALLLLLAVSVRTVAAQSDPMAPTDPNNPIKLLVDNLNSPAGAALKAAWNIDRAVWHEPFIVVDNSGVARLVTPAYGEIHISSVPFTYPSGGVMPQDPKVPSKARLDIPRTYGTNAVERMVVICPPNILTEGTFPGLLPVRDPMLRRGWLLGAQNSVAPGPIGFRPPHTYLEWGPRYNQGTRFLLDMLSGANRLSGASGFGLGAPRYVYGDSFSRGAQTISDAVTDPNTPVDGVSTMASESWFVPRDEFAPGVIKLLHAVNPADEASMQTYFQNIGRMMTITAANGTTRTEVISSVLNPDYRFFFGLSPAAAIKFPNVIGYAQYGITFTYNTTSFDQYIHVGVMSALRALLAEADPEYLAAVDAGTVLLRDWDPAQRPAEVQDWLNKLLPSGILNRKMIRYIGHRDAVRSAVLDMGLTRRFLDAGGSNNLRYYSTRNGASKSMVEETFIDSTGKSQSLGLKLNDVDALMRWVETGAEPGDIVMLDSADATSTKEVAVSNAHQVGLQGDPVRYFEWIEGVSPLPQPRSGVFFFAQAGGGGGFSTTINLANPSSSKPISGAVSFFSSDGKPLAGVVDKSEVPFSIPPAGSATISTKAQGNVQSGYARITSADPTIATAIYSLPGLFPISVDPGTPAAFVYQAPVSRDVASAADVGVSVVNVSDRSVRVVLSVVDSGGKSVASAKTSVLLAPGEQLSQFLSEILPGLPGKFTGTLRVAAVSPLPSQSIVVTAVQFAPGFFKAAPLTLLDKLAPWEEERVR